jgi:hypothetical protein
MLLRNWPKAERYVAHLWIGPRSLGQAWNPEDFMLESEINAKDPERWQIIRALANTAIDHFERVLRACPNLRSLAVCEQLVPHYPTGTKFRLTEFVSAGNSKGATWANYDSLQTVRRMYLAPFHVNAQTAERMNRLQSLEELEMTLTSQDIGTIRRLVVGTLACPRIRHITVIAEAELIAQGAIQMPADGRVRLRELERGLEARSMLEEWEERTRHEALWG